MQVAILGLGRFGTQLVEELANIGVEVLAIDIDPERVNEITETAFLAAQGNLTDVDFLRSLGLENYDTVVVAVGSDAATSVLTTLNLKKRLNIRHLVAKASTNDHAEALRLAGADIVVSPEQETAVRLAHTLGSRHVGDYLSLGTAYGVAKVQAPETAYRRRVEDLDILKNNRVFLIARVRGDNVSFNPSLDEVVLAGDFWVVAGRDEDLRALEA
jgi:trk system potassium uptake protein